MSRASVWSVAGGVAWRLLHHAFTRREIFLPSVLFPLIFFVGFAGGLSRVDQVRGFDYEPGYVTFQFAFVLLQSAAMAGVFTGFGIARDFEYGFARRLMLAAPRRGGIVIGYALATLVRWLVTAAVVFLVALVTGLEIHGGGIDLGALVLLALVLNVVGTLWAAGVALRLRSIQAGPVMQMPVFILLFLAPVFVPLDLLRGWIHGVAAVNPITALLEAARSLLAGNPEGVGVAFAIVAALGAVLSVWALRGLRSAEQAG